MLIYSLTNIAFARLHIGNGVWDELVKNGDMGEWGLKIAIFVVTSFLNDPSWDVTSMRRFKYIFKNILFRWLPWDLSKHFHEGALYKTFQIFKNTSQKMSSCDIVRFIEISGKVSEEQWIAINQGYMSISGMTFAFGVFHDRMVSKLFDVILNFQKQLLTDVSTCS